MQQMLNSSIFVYIHVSTKHAIAENKFCHTLNTQTISKFGTHKSKTGHQLQLMLN